MKKKTPKNNSDFLSNKKKTNLTNLTVKINIIH